MATQAAKMQKAGEPEVKTPPILLDQTQRILTNIEAVLKEPVITYWNGPNGSICANDVNGLYGVLRTKGKVDHLSLFVKADGGSGQASLRMINLLRQYTKRLTVLVPLECASAATMLALGADRILMGPLAHLSAVDTSLTHDLSPIDRDNDRVSVSSDELGRVVRLWKRQSKRQHESNPYQHLFSYVHPLVIGAVDRSSALSTKLCVEILSYHMRDMRKARRISNILNSGYPSHSYPITLREARRIGLHTESLDPRTNELLFELNAIYSEMGQRCSTDFDESNSHDNTLLNIIEGQGQAVYFQNDKDWHYRTEERRWVTLNDKSGWKRAELVNGRVDLSTFHIR